MTKLLESEKQKRRPGITKLETHSTGTVDVPMVDIEPSDSCTPATVHVILGITPWIVRAMRASFRKLETLEYEATTPGTAPPQFQESVEESVRQLNDYEHALEDKLKGTVNAVNQQQQMIQKLYEHIAYHQHLVNQSRTSWEQFVWTARLQQLRQHQQEAMEARNQMSEQKIENEAHLMGGVGEDPQEA